MSKGVENYLENTTFCIITTIQSPQNSVIIHHLMEMIYKQIFCYDCLLRLTHKSRSPCKITPNSWYVAIKLFLQRIIQIDTSCINLKCQFYKRSTLYYPLSPCRVAPILPSTRFYMWKLSIHTNYWRCTIDPQSLRLMSLFSVFPITMGRYRAHFIKCCYVTDRSLRTHLFNSRAKEPSYLGRPKLVVSLVERTLLTMEKETLISTSNAS